MKQEQRLRSVMQRGREDARERERESSARERQDMRCVSKLERRSSSVDCCCFAPEKFSLVSFSCTDAGKGVQLHHSLSLLFERNLLLQLLLPLATPISRTEDLARLPAAAAAAASE